MTVKANNNNKNMQSNTGVESSRRIKRRKTGKVLDANNNKGINLLEVRGYKVNEMTVLYQECYMQLSATSTFSNTACDI